MKVIKRFMSYQPHNLQFSFGIMKVRSIIAHRIMRKEKGPNVEGAISCNLDNDISLGASGTVDQL